MRPARPALTALLLAALALAGCASPEGADEGPADDDAQVLLGAGAARGENATAPLATDTLYLALPARLNATAAANLTILATLSGPLAQSVAWNATLNGTGLLTAARLGLWVDLQNSAVQTGVGGDVGCSAALSLAFVANNTTVVQPGGCASLGTGHIAPGEHLLEFSTPLVAAGPEGLRVRPGDGVTATVTFGFALPQGVGYVLGGGLSPSRLQLVGLAEPVEHHGKSWPPP